MFSWGLNFISDAQHVNLFSNRSTARKFWGVFAVDFVLDKEEGGSMKEEEDLDTFFLFLDLQQI